MHGTPRLLLAAALVAILAPAPAIAQARQQGTDSAKAARREKKMQKAIARASRGDTTGLKPAPLFADDGILHFTLTANYGRIKRDRQDTPPYHWARLTWTGPDGAAVDIPLEVRSRGIWRRHNCDLPPLRLHFGDKDSLKHTAFARQENLKLVVHCRDNDEYEQYLLEEFQLYRVYNLLTPMSHRVRLARVSYVDSGSTKPFATRYAFLLEDVDALAERTAAIVVKQKGAQPGDLEPQNDALLGVFLYLIGNTDFSISALHNIEILQRVTNYYGVAHDFDFSGAVNARYATVDPRLPIRNVRERLYRGYCVPDGYLPKVFALFDSQKPAIYALYSDSLGSLLARDRARGTLEYFDDFYRVIDDPRAAQREIVGQCLGR